MSPKLLLLHGVGLDQRMWDRCRPALERAYDVESPNLLGHGDAAPAPTGTTLATLTDAIAARLTGPVHVVGFSLGALIAQRLAYTRPDLVHRLVLVSSVCRRSDVERTRVLDRLRQAEEDLEATADAAVERWFTPRWRADDPQLVRHVRNTLAGNDHESYLSCYRVFATADAQVWPHLPTIKAPTLAITGSDDTGSTPEMTRRLAAVIPTATASVVDDARHLLPLQAPEALTNEVTSHLEASHVVR